MTDPIVSRVRHAVEAALDKKALDLDVLSVGKLTSIADYFIICSANSERQAAAIADAVQEKVKKEDQARPLLVEGLNPGRWVLLDYGDFIFHIFTQDCRTFYGLERLWGDAPNVSRQFTHGEEPPAEEPEKEEPAPKPRARRTTARADTQAQSAPARRRASGDDRMSKSGSGRGRSTTASETPQRRTRGGSSKPATANAGRTKKK